MKDLLKIGLLTASIAVFATGYSGCGDRGKPSPEKPDTNQTAIDSSKKNVDTTRIEVDTAKKDTTKKK